MDTPGVSGPSGSSRCQQQGLAVGGGMASSLKEFGWSFAGFEESYVHSSENTLQQCPFMELPLSLKGTMAPASPSGIVRLATCGPRHSGGAWSGCGCCSCPLLLVCAFCCWVPCCGQSLPHVLSATDAISSCCWRDPLTRLLPVKPQN
uniref:Uncharacterized protein n=1 Tax=Oryzias sinensis TaxID=183150 RepID=A0A8C8DU82_9TELE